MPESVEQPAPSLHNPTLQIYTRTCQAPMRIKLAGVNILVQPSARTAQSGISLGKTILLALHDSCDYAFWHLQHDVL